jgi:hypothetical protein
MKMSKMIEMTVMYDWWWLVEEPQSKYYPFRTIYNLIQRFV